MGCAGFSGKKIRAPQLAREAATRAAVEAVRKSGIVHGASLTRFLIVSNHLSSDLVEHAKLASFCWLPPERTGRSKRFNLGVE